jgi:hypothetical protein
MCALRPIINIVGAPVCASATLAAERLAAFSTAHQAQLVSEMAADGTNGTRLLFHKKSLLLGIRGDIEKSERMGCGGVISALNLAHLIG